jgi:hypothetical protein
VVTRPRQQLGGLAAWLIAMAALATPARAESLPFVAVASIRSLTEAPSGRPIPMPSAVADTPEPVDVAPAALPLTTSVSAREPTNLRSLVGEGDRWRLLDVGASGRWQPIGAKWSLSGQFPCTTADLSAGAPLEGTPEPASLAMKGEVEGFETGVQYRAVGKRLERLVGGPSALRDREGYELWAAQRLGLLKLRLSDSRLTDNVDRNPALARTTKDQDAVSAALSIPEWPVLELSYASGDSARVRLTPQGQESDPERADFDSLTSTAYYYGGPAWEATVSTTLSQSRSVLRPPDETVTLVQDLSLTLRLPEALTAVPSITLARERSTSALRSETGTAGLTLSWAPPARGWSTSTYAGYTATRTSDASSNARTVSLSAALSYALGTWMPPRSSIAVEAGYDRYVDAGVPQSSSRSLSGFVLLRIAGF